MRTREGAHRDALLAAYLDSRRQMEHARRIEKLWKFGPDRESDDTPRHLRAATHLLSIGHPA